MAHFPQPYNWLLVLILFVTLLGSATALRAMSPDASAQAPTSDSDPSVLPDRDFTTMDGQKISLYQFKGKTVLVHYWGTWCPPCIKELPNLLSVVKNNDRVVVLAVTVDRNLLAVKDFLSRVNANPPPKNVYFIMDPESSIMIGNRPVNRFPTTYVISPNMYLADRINGGLDWNGYSF